MLISLRNAVMGSLMAAIPLTGCTSVEGLRPEISAKPLPSRLDEIAYINELRSGIVEDDNENCYDGESLREFKSKSSQGYRKGQDKENFLSGQTSAGEGGTCLRFGDADSADDADKKTLQRYMAAGFGLTDIYCRRFFTVAIDAQQNRVFGKSLASGVDTLVGAILGASGVGPDTLTIVNSSFGFADKSFDSYDLAFLVGPDMPEVERLVKAEQAKFRQSALDAKRTDFPTNYAGARLTIEGYAANCSFSGMRQLVSKSIADRAEKLNKSTADDRKPGKDKAGDGVTDGGDGTVDTATDRPINSEILANPI